MHPARRTVHETLQNVVHGTLYTADSLVVEHHHLPAHSNRRACERQQRDVHVLLPKMTDHVDAAHELELLAEPEVELSE